MEKELATEALHKVKILHHVVTENYLDLDKLLESYLSIGNDLFGLEVGIASHVSGEDYNVTAVSKNPFGLKEGDQFELKDTYCREVFKYQKTVSVDKAGETEPFKSHPIYENLKLESYISAPIYVDGDIYGTLNFSSLKARSVPFGEFDQDLIELMAKSIGSFIEMKEVKSIADKHKEQAYLSSRMASLGQMAGGVAHEINNPLGIISMSCVRLESLLKEDTVDTKKTHETVSIIENTVKRIGGIVQGLKSISRNTSMDEMELEDLGEIISNTLSVCSEKIKSRNIEVRVVDFAEIKIPCRGGEISQVILNLISNSLDAVEDLDAKWIEIKVLENKDFVVVSIVDSGSGFTAEEADKIMEPFYTTKPAGKGTGLGLSISKKIVELHGGELKADLKSKNTKIDILLNK